MQAGACKVEAHRAMVFCQMQVDAQVGVFRIDVWPATAALSDSVNDGVLGF